MSKQYATYHAEKGLFLLEELASILTENRSGTYLQTFWPRAQTFESKHPSEWPLQKPLHVGISDRIAQGYSAKNKAGELKAIRKDAVKYTTHIMTGSHEQMKKSKLIHKPEKLGLMLIWTSWRKNTEKKTLFVLQFIEMKKQCIFTL